jgi:hypothetical protein
MMRHVVMWVFPEESAGRARDENMARAIEMLRELPAEIPVIRRFDVVTNQLAGDKQAHLLLDSDFDDWDALETYQQHPAHLAVVAFFGEAGTTRWAVDYDAT